MKKITPLTGFTIGIGILFIAVSTAFARSHMRQGSGGGGSSNVIGLCWTDPSGADDVSTNYGVIFELEPGNANEIAADIYSLDSNRQKIKQVGHADVTSAIAEDGSATFTSASDSPSQFSLTITRDTSIQDQQSTTKTGQLANAVLFNGEVASNVALKCRAK
jgi:hypothetical protein